MHPKPFSTSTALIATLNQEGEFNPITIHIMPIKTVCVVGANGTLGSVITQALVSNTFTVSVLRRTTSTSPLPAGVTEIPVSPSLPLDELTAALAGQDAVVAAFPLADVSQHLRLAQAAFDARVRRYMPVDYGSCDAASARARHHLQLYRDKTAVRAKCEQLALLSVSARARARAQAQAEAGGDGDGEGGPAFTWTSVVCGHFFDYGLRSGLLHFDMDGETAHILDAGDVRASASTLGRVAEAVVRVLRRPGLTENKAVYVQSFCPTQLEILASLERATGSKWRTRHLDSSAYLEKQAKRLADGHHDAVEEIVFVLGTVDADWTTREGFAMELLGLEDERLDDVVAKVVADHKVGKEKKRKPVV